MESHRITLSLPPRWATRHDPPPGTLLIARPVRAGGALAPVGPEVVLRAVEVPEPDLSAWRARALDELAARAIDLALEDDDEYDLCGRRVRYHRFAHRVGLADVLTEQWAWFDASVGVTLSCSLERGDYPLYCDLFEDIAATVEIAPAADATTGLSGGP
ncbi:hypothetical protein E8D34_15790 [Nocardioides sp. GY 10113]|uniref:hypothetical protein n=1 Tax=Nocardioides sp. GY 10113 TaxID=2569761 RepID=UPI0010A8B3B0|nr:hypothetical protein [Nocardioides sp. GY 10113]TIC83584.1 hypothetical protein E8D34_15790 [Nocardioides sp. GY 10113]